jgi:hypothetical protein
MAPSDYFFCSLNIKKILTGKRFYDMETIECIIMEQLLKISLSLRGASSTGGKDRKSVPLGFDSWQEQRFFCLPPCPYQLWGPPSLLSLRVKQLKRAS